MIRNPNDIQEGAKKIRMLIAGYPGIGKSTLALSAPNPLHIDVDFGIDRIEPRYRKPYIQPQSYDEILGDLTPINLQDFDTLVFDTGGKLISLMSLWAIKKDPKYGQRDGSLSLKGYGFVGKEFVRLMDYCFYELQKNIVIVFHATEEKDGDNTRLRIKVEGQTKNNPIIFTIKPVQGMDAQISMLENVEEVGYRSPDASMSWIFEDGGLDTKVTGGTFTISKTLRTKIESILVKMITYWQQYFFRDVLEKNALRSGLMPVIDEDEAGDTDEEPEDEGDMQDEDGPEVDLDDPDIQQAITIVRAENKATVGLLQRRMSVGYAKAARLIDALEELGVVGPYNGSDGREVLPTDEPDDTEGGED